MKFNKEKGENRRADSRQERYAVLLCVKLNAIYQHLLMDSVIAHVY